MQRLLLRAVVVLILLCGLADRAPRAVEAQERQLVGDVVVAGTGGDRLRLHSGPGLDFPVAESVPEGTRLRIVAGPQSDGTLDWYQVERADRSTTTSYLWAAGAYLVPSERGTTAPPSGGQSFLARVTGYAVGAVGTLTSSGTPVRWGVISVDPSVIPLGSLVAIEGFDRPFSAEDTGAAVKGRMIEIWFPDVEQALRWGNQPRVVTVLGPPDTAQGR